MSPSPSNVQVEIRAIVLQFPAPVDFKALIWSLQIRGFTIAALAMHANVPRSSMRDYGHGTIVPHHIGERLIALWQQITGQPKAKIPLKTV
jgi:hypothetical protein